jgi:hypothetical protein
MWRTTALKKVHPRNNLLTTLSFLSSFVYSSQAALWDTRKEAQLLTDPASGALWYLGGTYSSGAATNEIDQFLNGSWNANITTSTVMGFFSSGTAHLVGSKIYIFGGFGSTGGQRSYQSFQSLPYIDISTTPPTVGTQVQEHNPRAFSCNLLQNRSEKRDRVNGTCLFFIPSTS